ncbi:hypothetical protein [Pseudonocardia sp. TRM90224]|uniref:hypothetical protein n=1 Tax=Pseudonocardia sp. TRM90224 TaxID=2812678 RepID=UPI001E3D1BD7|nr:hypothetical protein [Pseudonocardia sp. TRM90224]
MAVIAGQLPVVRPRRNLSPGGQAHRGLARGDGVPPDGATRRRRARPAQVGHQHAARRTGGRRTGRQHHAEAGGRGAEGDRATDEAEETTARAGRRSPTDMTSGTTGEHPGGQQRRRTGGRKAHFPAL